MRTVIFCVALALTDIASSMGKIYPEASTSIWGWILLICIVMDVVDFLRGKK